MALNSPLALGVGAHALVLPSGLKLLYFMPILYTSFAYLRCLEHVQQLSRSFVLCAHEPLSQTLALLSGHRVGLLK